MKPSLPPRVWIPRREPSVAQLKAWTPDAVGRLEQYFASPHPAWRHVVAAAHRNVSLVTVGPPATATHAPLELAATILQAAGVPHRVAKGAQTAADVIRPAGTWLVDSEEGVQRALEVGAAQVIAYLVPSATTRRSAERIAEQRGECGYAEGVTWDRLRTRVVAPFRNQAAPDPDQIAGRLAAERARAMAAGEPIAEGASVQAAEWAARLAALDADRPAGVLLCATPRACLRALIVADRVAAGQFSEDDDTAIEARADAIIAQVARSLVSSRERAVYTVLGSLPANREHATSIVAMVEASRA